MFGSLSPACIALVVITLSVPCAQRIEGKSRPQASSSATAPCSTTKDQKRALALIKQILGETSKFADDLLRLKAQTQIADALWDCDKARAHRLFEETFQAVESLEAKVGQGHFSSAPDLVDSLQFEMRKEVLQAVSKRDGELAEKLAGSIPFGKAVKNRDPAIRQLAFDRELVEHDLTVAINIAETDPQRAARLARDSLNRVISGSFTKLIRSMRVNNPDLADQLFLDALSALERRPTYVSNKIGILAPYVFPKPKDEPANYSDEGVNPALITRFLDVIYDTLMRQTPDSQANENSPFGAASFDYKTLHQILPYFEKQSPQRAAEVRSRIDEIVRNINESGRKDRFDSEDDAWAELFRSNVQELVSKANASKRQEERDELYSNAAFLLAQRENDFEKALPLIEKINDQKKRVYILALVRAGAARSAILKGDTDRAYRYASDVTDPDEHIRMFHDIARKLIDKKETERAMEVVNETGHLIEHLSDESTRAEDFLVLAGIASRLSPSKGFQVMRSAVEAINRADFGPHWSGQTTFKKAQTSDVPQAVRRVSGLEWLEFGQSFPFLARADFGKALALAQAIRMKEASLLAQLAVCTGMLGKRVSAQTTKAPGQ